MARFRTVEVTHPETGEVSQVRLPAGHDGSRVKVEFPDGAITYTDGWDPAQRALLFEGQAPDDAERKTDSDAGSTEEQ